MGCVQLAYIWIQNSNKRTRDPGYDLREPWEKDIKGERDVCIDGRRV